MPIPITHCTNCGASFQSAFTGMVGAGIVSLSGNQESCPRCGAMCRTPDGTFDLRQQVWEAIRQPQMTKQKVQAFKDTVEAVRSGDASANDAAADLAKISEAFAAIFRLVGTDKHAQAMLVAILALLLTYYGIICSNEGSAQAHADAQAQLAATQRIDAEIQSLSAHVAKMETKVRLLPSHQGKTFGPDRPKNRHERRKVDALNRKNRP